MKYYAVFSGHNPGIYNTWQECLDQVRNHRYSRYKSFLCLEDAQKFLETGDYSVGRSARKASKTLMKEYEEKEQEESHPPRRKRTKSKKKNE